ncbi:MAG TPA: hypothetical protein VFQ49_05760, partial [Actinomycetes bacterium]|nr:hypothetical protein [Actinomycetes bacterium]
MPWNFALPAPRRLLRITGIGALGIALGVGATLAVDGLGGAGRAERAASVQRLDLPAGMPSSADRPAEAMAAAPVRAGSARAAVRRFLRAGVAGDDAVAYGLLDRAGR